MGKLVETSERAVLRGHLSWVNTQISSSVTNVMVQGVSLNNPATTARDSKSWTSKGQREKGNSAAIIPHFQSVQYFDTFNITIKRITKQQGHGACLNLTAFYPLFPLRGTWGNMHEKPQVRDWNCQNTLSKKFVTDWSHKRLRTISVLLQFVGV